MRKMAKVLFCHLILQPAMVCVCVCFWVAGGGLFYLKYRVHGIAGEAVVSLPLVVDPVDATMKHLVNVSVSMKKA